MAGFKDTPSYRWRTQQVFISSTFRDFHAERDYMIKNVFPRLRQWCLQWKLHLVDIDLRWGVTEEEAKLGKVLELCLKGVDGARPFFICMLGGRYGEVPTDDDRAKIEPSTNKEFPDLINVSKWKDRSLTHLEIIHAAIDPFKKIEKVPHAFFYFRDADCMPEEMPYYSETNKDKLRDLKKDIITAFGDNPLAEKPKINWKRVYPYAPIFDKDAPNPEDDDLNGRIVESSLEAFGERMYSDLLKAIEGQYSDRIAHLKEKRKESPLQSELDFHEAYIEERTQGYIPRIALTNQLHDYLKNKSDQILPVYGEPGSGKSALLAHFYKQYKYTEKGEGLHSDEVIIPHFIGASPQSTSLLSLLRRLCEILKEQFSVEGEIPVELSKLEETFKSYLEKADRKTIIILDGLNQLDDMYDSHELRWLPKKLPVNIKIIASTLDGKAKDALQEKVNEGTLLKIGELTNDERLDILESIPNLFAKKLELHQIEALFENDGSKNPLWLKVALEELRLFGSYEKLDDRIIELKKYVNVEDIFVHVLERLEDQCKSDDNSKEQNGSDENLVKKLFCLLECSRFGLTEQEIEELLPEDESKSHRVILRQLRSLFQYSEDVLDFHHRSFSKAVRKRYDLEVDAPKWHLQLAQYFNNQPLFFKNKPNEDPNKRKVLELPFQLISQGSMWELVEQTLCDLWFLDAKVQLGFASDLLTDYYSVANYIQLKEGAADGKELPIHSKMSKYQELVYNNITFLRAFGTNSPNLIIQLAFNQPFGELLFAGSKSILENEPFNLKSNLFFALSDGTKRQGNVNSPITIINSTNEEKILNGNFSDSGKKFQWIDHLGNISQYNFLTGEIKKIITIPGEIVFANFSFDCKYVWINKKKKVKNEEKTLGVLGLYDLKNFAMLYEKDLDEKGFIQARPSTFYTKQFSHNQRESFNKTLQKVPEHLRSHFKQAYGSNLGKVTRKNTTEYFLKPHALSLDGKTAICTFSNIHESGKESTVLGKVVLVIKWTGTNFDIKEIDTASPIYDINCSPLDDNIAIVNHYGSIGFLDIKKAKMLVTLLKIEKASNLPASLIAIDDKFTQIANATDITTLNSDPAYKISVWDTNSEQLIRSYNVAKPKYSKLIDLKMSADGKVIIVGYSRGSLGIINQKEIILFGEISINEIMSISIMPDVSKIVVYNSQEIVYINLKSINSKFEQQERHAEILDELNVQLLPDGEHALSSSPGIIKIWSLKNGKLAHEFKKGIRGLGGIFDNKVIQLAPGFPSYKGLQIVLSKIKGNGEGDHHSERNKHLTFPIIDAKYPNFHFNINNEKYLSISRGTHFNKRLTRLVIWKKNDNYLHQEFAVDLRPKERIKDIAIGPEKKFLFIATTNSNRGFIHTLKIETGELVERIEDRNSLNRRIYMPHSENYFFTFDLGLQKRSIPTCNILKTFSNLSKMVKISSDFTTAVDLNKDGVKVINLENFEEYLIKHSIDSRMIERETTYKGGSAWKFRITPSGDKAVIFFKDLRFEIWDLKKRSCTKSIVIVGGKVGYVKIIHNGKYLITAVERFLTIWCLETGNQIQTLKLPYGSIFSWKTKRVGGSEMLEQRGNRIDIDNDGHIIYGTTTGNVGIGNILELRKENR